MVLILLLPAIIAVLGNNHLSGAQNQRKTSNHPDFGKIKAQKMPKIGGAAAILPQFMADTPKGCANSGMVALTVENAASDFENPCYSAVESGSLARTHLR